MATTRLVFLFVSVIAASGAVPPKYITLNRVPGLHWNQNDPASITNALFTEVTEGIAAPVNPNLRVGVSFLLSLLDTPTPVVVETVRRILNASVATGVPVMLGLDGENWWDARGDLWNWWNASLPGYNPDNIHNVERTAANISAAEMVKISWRDWGSQIRVSPAQNIHSPVVLRETINAFVPVLAVIAAWYRGFSLDQQYLLVGIKIGWEAGIGANAYYYPNGNYYEEHYPDTAAHDPNHPLLPEKGVAYGMQPIGYAAAVSSGLRSPSSTAPLTAQDIGLLSQWYLSNLTSLAVEAGLPADKLFTHLGGNDAPYDLHVPFSAAFTAGTSPGWSFYRMVSVYNWDSQGPGEGSFDRRQQAHAAVRDLVKSWPQ